MQIIRVGGQWITLMGVMISGILLPSLAFSQTPPAAGAEPALVDIILKIEKRYDVAGFAAEFHQESTITALGITDTARGKMFVRRPNMMRWEYETPEPQIIITNGKRLWVYRPQDKQVMIGQAPAFFGDGKGAGFLADIKMLRRKFSITRSKADPAGYYRLKLEPLEKTIDLAEIHLLVSKKTFTVQRVITYNAYRDETTIELINPQFDQQPDLSLFTFTIPEGVDVLTMDQ
jgi:outer membrane lipoprotein carrier protein